MSDGPKLYRAIVVFEYIADDKADAVETVNEIMAGGIAMATATYDVRSIRRVNKKKG